MIENGSHPAPATEQDSLAAGLLQSVVEVARAIFGAQASSVFLLDEDADELIFQAVAGRGEGFLVGRRIPATGGIAGWVVASGEPMVVDDLARNTAFDRDLAVSTQYVPDSLMAAPLVHGGRTLGVLEVLDPAAQSRSDLAELDLLALFARQAAAALRIVSDRRMPRPRAALDVESRETALDLVANLRRLLETAV